MRPDGPIPPSLELSGSFREVMNADQAAEFLGFSAYTLREKARAREIPGRKIGREWRFSRRQLLEWIESTEANGIDQELDGRDRGAIKRGQRGGNVQPHCPTLAPKKGKREKTIRLV